MIRVTVDKGLDTIKIDMVGEVAGGTRDLKEVRTVEEVLEPEPNQSGKRVRSVLPNTGR